MDLAVYRVLGETDYPGPGFVKMGPESRQVKYPFKVIFN